MIQIIDELIAALKTVSFPASGVKVIDAYSVATPTCPMLTLDEQPSNDGAYIDGQPCIVRNLFTLESYAQNMSISGKPTTKRAAAMQIISEADTFLNQQFGLTMIGPIQAAPYSDSTIYRAVANYYVYIDTRTNTVYRSIKK